jgi:hypothetical protein
MLAFFRVSILKMPLPFSELPIHAGFFSAARHRTCVVLPS